MRKTGAYARSLVVALAVIGVYVCGDALAVVDSGGYEAPAMEGFRLTHEEDGDGNGDGVKETHIRHYRNADNVRMFSMVTRGRLWAWSRESGDSSNDIQQNYVIVDSNCDGRFDTRYSLDEEFHLPACLGSEK